MPDVGMGVRELRIKDTEGYLPDFVYRQI